MISTVLLTIRMEAMIRPKKGNTDVLVNGDNRPKNSKPKPKSRSKTLIINTFLIGFLKIRM